MHSTITLNRAESSVMPKMMSVAVANSRTDVVVVVAVVVVVLELPLLPPLLLLLLVFDSALSPGNK